MKSLSLLLLSLLLLNVSVSAMHTFEEGTPPAGSHRIIEALGTSHVHRDGEIDQTDLEIVTRLERKLLERELEEFVSQLDDEELDDLEQRLEVILQDQEHESESSLLLAELEEIGFDESDIEDFSVLAEDITEFLMTIPTLQSKLGLTEEGLSDHVKMYLLGLDNKLGPIGFLALHHLIKGEERIEENLGPSQDYGQDMRRKRGVEIEDMDGMKKGIDLGRQSSVELEEKDTKQEEGMMEGYGKRRRSSEAEEMDKDQGYSMKEGMQQWRRRRDAVEGDMTDSEQRYGMKEGFVEKRRRSAGEGEMDQDRGYGMHAGYGGYGRTGAEGGEMSDPEGMMGGYGGYRRRRESDYMEDGKVDPEPEGGDRRRRSLGNMVF